MREYLNDISEANRRLGMRLRADPKTRWAMIPGDWRFHPYLFLALATLIVAALLAIGAFAWWANRVVFDDAYISYRYAENLIKGNGLVYNPGERVEGYTNFLWVLIGAAALAIGWDASEATQYLGVAAYLVTLAITSIFFLIKVVERRVTPLLLLPFLLTLVLPGGYAASSGSGLETSFVALLLLAMGYFRYIHQPSSRFGRSAMLLLPSVACLTRVESVLAVFARAVATVVYERRLRRSFRSALSRTALEVAPTVFVVLGYLGWKLSYYGDILPNSYYAKGADQFNFAAGFLYLKAFCQSNPQVFPLFVLIAIGWISLKSARTAAFYTYGSITIVLYLSYIVKVGGDFMQYRFVWQLYPLYVVLSIVGLASVTRNTVAVALLLSATVVMGSVHDVVLEKRYGMQSLEEMNRYATEGREIGPLLSKLLPEKTVIATTLAGTMAYRSRLKIIDQWGLNDSYVRHYPRPHNYFRGHRKYATDEHLKKRGVSLCFAHPVVCKCSALCKQNLPNVFIRMGDNRCLRSWYFQQKDQLTEYFCEHPQWFILHNVECKRR
ncbi:MAG: hypothetical protein JXA30_23240 [Deltaproteobacteria bacterium]|nr:hypothetical protein [Deltaproteobacteria bacterium]